VLICERSYHLAGEVCPTLPLQLFRQNLGNELATVPLAGPRVDLFNQFRRQYQVGSNHFCVSGHNFAPRLCAKVMGLL
jgi:hypothetical protein